MKNILTAVVAASMLSTASIAFAAESSDSYNRPHQPAQNSFSQSHQRPHNGYWKTIDVVDKSDAAMVIHDASKNFWKPNYINAHQLR